MNVEEGSMKRLERFNHFTFPSQFFLIATLFVLLISMSCSIKEPVAPQWDVTVAIPLMNRAIPLEELMDDTDYLVTGENGLVNIDYEEEFERFELGDQLKMANIDESFSSNLGEFRVPSPGVNSAGLTFGQMYPPAILLDGQTVPVGGFSYDSIKVDLPSFNSFRSILIESGSIQLTINNNLPVPLAAGVGIQARDRNTDAEIFSIFFNSDINPGASSSEAADLGGVRIPADISVYLTGGSPGSGGQLIQINANSDGIDVDALISDIVAVEAEAVVESQEFSGTDSLALGDSMLVNYAEIAGGVFRLEITNNIPLNLELDLLLEDFFDAAGNQVMLNIPLLNGQTTTRFINLWGHSFQPEQNPDELRTHFSWTARVFGSNGNIITLSREDGVALGVELTDLSFSEVRGILGNVHVELDPVEESFDIPDEVDSLQFEVGRLELTINNGIGFTIFPDIRITGINESTGRSSEVIVSQQIAPANGGPVPTMIVLDKSNSNIVNLINILPNKIQVTGDVLVGDGSSEGVIKNTDFIESIVHITAPLSLSIPSQSVTLDVDTLDIDADIQEELRDNVLSGKLIAKLANRIPLGMQVSLHVSSRDTSVYANPELTIGPQTVNASQGGGEVSSDLVVELSKEEIAVFANGEIFVGLSAFLPGSNGEVVRFYSNDYIDVKAYAELIYHVDPDEN
jgi:hypothetical protein